MFGLFFLAWFLPAAEKANGVELICFSEPFKSYRLKESTSIIYSAWILL